MSEITFKYIGKNNKDEVKNLFMSVFNASEGQEEGKLISNLASQLCCAINNEEIVSIAAYIDDVVIGAIYFTRLLFDEDIMVYLLAPVAVSTNHQKQGVGKALIKFGLEVLGKKSVDIVVTYGDPAYYSKSGFQPLSENNVKAPFKLSMPEGWLGLSLNNEFIPVIRQRPKCVKEFNNPAYW